MDNVEKEVKNYIGAIIKFSNKMYLESPVTDKEDLVQAGFIGMINGLASFSEEKSKIKGAKKTTYVIQCIHNAILQEANKFFGATALPHNKRLKLNSFKKLMNQNKPKEDIKTLLSLSDDEYDEFNNLLQLKSVVNIDTLSEKDNHSILHIDSFEEKIDDTIFKKAGLIDEDVQILKLKLSGLSYNEIATQYNISRETIRKRIHKALLMVKNSIKEE